MSASALRATEPLAPKPADATTGSPERPSSPESPSSPETPHKGAGERAKEKAKAARDAIAEKSRAARDAIAERVPLMAAVRDGDLYAAYGLESHGTWKTPPFTDEQCLVDYEPLKFSSFRVCCLRRGTIMESPVIIVEQLILIGIFTLCAVPVYCYFKEDTFSGKDAPSLRRFVEEQEGKMRAFAMIMTGLAAFLLSFYTSIIVTRWWTMRTGGIGGIKAAAVDLELLLCQSVTQDPKVLSAVRRYSRTSMILIFLWRRKAMGAPGVVSGPEIEELRKTLVTHKLLSDEECTQLLKWGKHCLHETIWAWMMAIVNKLHQEKKIPSDQLYALLLQKCTEGRAAVQLLHTHLAVRVPMQYVHLLGLLVKMHNIVIAIIMGLLFGASVRSQKWVLAIQLAARVFILPFLFNAILLINCDLADPFDGGEADFPGAIYQDTLDQDCRGIIGATQHVPEQFRVPEWLQLQPDYVLPDLATDSDPV